MIRRYTPEEDEIIRQLYPRYEEMLALMPWRTRKGLEDRAQRVLQIASTRWIWSAAESTKLRKLLEAGTPWKQIFAAIPDRTPQSIKKHAWCRGMRMSRRYAAAAAPAVETLRSLARERGLSMAQLDRLAGSGKYFMNRHHPARLRHIVSAAKVLGARVTIRWHSDPWD